MCTSRRLNNSRMHINLHFACKEIKENNGDLLMYVAFSSMQTATVEVDLTCFLTSNVFVQHC